MSNHTKDPDDTGDIDGSTEDNPSSGAPSDLASDGESNCDRPVTQRRRTPCTSEPNLSTTAPEQRPEMTPRRFALNLSVIQVIGGSLAAATAAVVGSKLGVAGTIGGTALFSVISAVAASVYTTSMRRTHAGIRGAWSRRTTTAAAADPEAQQMLDPIPRTKAAARASQHAQINQSGDDTAPSRANQTMRRGGPKSLVAGVLAIFVLASIVIFGFEEFSGQALDGQKGSTSFGQALGSSPSQQHKRSKTGTDKSPGPSPSASAATPSAEPSKTGTDKSPGPSPSASAATPSAEPSSSGVPSTAPSAPASSQPPTSAASGTTGPGNTANGSASGKTGNGSASGKSSNGSGNNVPGN